MQDWKDTGRRGDYGKIYRNRHTGELAEEHDNTYLVAVEDKPECFNGHSYLIEQDRIARGLPV